MINNEDERIFIQSDALDILETEITYKEYGKIIKEILKDYHAPDNLEVELNNEKFFKFIKLYKDVNRFFCNKENKIITKLSGAIQKGFSITIECKKNTSILNIESFLELVNSSDVVNIYNESGQVKILFVVRGIFLHGCNGEDI